MKIEMNFAKLSPNDSVRFKYPKNQNILCETQEEMFPQIDTHSNTFNCSRPLEMDLLKGLSKCTVIKALKDELPYNGV